MFHQPLMAPQAIDKLLKDQTCLLSVILGPELQCLLRVKEDLS